jgi:site-specific DNA-methyltransferase (adenine-specific)
MNQLHYGDNLRVLRDSIRDESVDLIYLDPPFNSNAGYNILFKGPAGSDSTAQIEAFDDTWHWNDSAEAAFGDVMRGGNANVSQMLRAMRSFLGDNDMMAYLAMMAVRLIELHRVLKPTGSLYLHCDPTASHYLKILLDAVFGKGGFQNEIIWKRSGSHGGAKRWGPIHDTILFVSKSESYQWNKTYQTYDAEYLENFYRFNDDKGRYRLVTLTGAGKRNGDSGQPWRGVNPTDSGRHWAVPIVYMRRMGLNGGLDKMSTQEKLDFLDENDLVYWPKKGKVPQFKRYLDETEGVPLQSIITDIGPLSSHAAERLGYPTQKPVALLERILAASSNEGDVILDPFCGCGTTVHAAQKMNRQWIGIDITHLAIGLIEKRLREAFPAVQFKTYGVPQDIEGARDMAARGRDDKNYYFEFEKWALSLIAAQPGNLSKKGADKGIDGNIYFGPKSEGRAIVSVKAGDNVGVAMIRDLRGVIEREGASVGVFLTLSEPSRPMITEAAGAGQFEMDGFSPVPRIQIVTIQQAMELRDRAVRLPAKFDNFKKAAPEVDTTRQKALDF